MHMLQLIHMCHVTLLLETRSCDRGTQEVCCINNISLITFHEVMMVRWWLLSID